MVKGDDLFGDGVNVAARLEGLAEPGGICVSSSVFDQIKHKLSLSFDDIGPQQVKNVAEPVSAFRIVPGPVSVAGTAEPALEPGVAPRWRIPAIAAAVLVVVAVGAAAIWDAYSRPAPPPQVLAEPSGRLIQNGRSASGGPDLRQTSQLQRERAPKIQNPGFRCTGRDERGDHSDDPTAGVDIAPAVSPLNSVVAHR